jgi:outer membrane biosynthesis protein TonB
LVPYLQLHHQRPEREHKNPGQTVAARPTIGHLQPRMKRAGYLNWRGPEDYRNFFLGLGASLALHAAGLFAWILVAAAAVSLSESLARDRQTPRALQIPTVFVEVNPDQASPTAPEDTPFYSTVNSLAANPEPEVDTGQPRIDGNQQAILRTVEVPRPGPQPLQPAPPPDIQPLVPQRPEPSLPTPPADLAVAPEPAPTAPPAETRPRPRTLVEARLRQGILAGPQSRQEGGVRRRGAISVDARASPLGGYDSALIAAIQQRWYNLLDDSAVAPRSGRVVVEFTLHLDGRVTEARIVEQEVGELLALYCRKAITDPAPYPRWPDEMRHLLGRDYREVRFTFHYF